MAMRMTFPEICIDSDERRKGSGSESGKVKQICKVVVELTVEEGESTTYLCRLSCALIGQFHYYRYAEWRGSDARCMLGNLNRQVA